MMDYVGFKGFMGNIAVVLGSQITTSMGPKLVILGHSRRWLLARCSATTLEWSRTLCQRAL